MRSAGPAGADRRLSVFAECTAVFATTATLGSSSAVRANVRSQCRVGWTALRVGRGSSRPWRRKISFGGSAWSLRRPTTSIRLTLDRSLFRGRALRTARSRVRARELCFRQQELQTFWKSERQVPVAGFALVYHRSKEWGNKWLNEFPASLLGPRATRSTVERSDGGGRGRNQLYGTALARCGV